MDRYEADSRLVAADWTDDEREAFWMAHAIQAAGLTDEEAVVLYRYGYIATPREV